MNICCNNLRDYFTSHAWKDTLRKRQRSFPQRSSIPFQLVPIAFQHCNHIQGRVWARRQLYNTRLPQPTEINHRRSWTCLARQPSWFSWGLEREFGVVGRGGEVVAVKLTWLEFDVFEHSPVWRWRNVRWEKSFPLFLFFTSFGGLRFWLHELHSVTSRVLGTFIFV